MPVICYQEKNFRTKSMELIKLCNQIIAEMAAQGYALTLRQLYYQLVGRAIIPNNEKSYDNIGALISDARLAGLIDWDDITDRTRGLMAVRNWESPSARIDTAKKDFHLDWWEGQNKRLEVWVEKDALKDVVGQAATRYDVPFFSCRGYTSQTAMWEAAQRIIGYYEDKSAEEVIILHFGDHDPSGIDMTRDIEERLALFCEAHGHAGPHIERLSLNMDQVRRYKLPPNPAKLTDCRAKGYIAEYGNESWELDALNPKVIDDLITTTILDNIDGELLASRQILEEKGRKELTLISQQYDAIVKRLQEKKK